MNQIKILYFISQIFLVNLAFGLSNLIIFDTFWVDGWAYPSLLIVVNIATLISFLLTRQYNLKANMNLFQIIQECIEFLLFILFIVLIYRISINAPKYYRIGLLLFISFSFVLKLLIDRFFIHIYRKNNLLTPTNNSTILGEGLYNTELISEMENNSYLGMKYMATDENQDANSLKKFVQSNNIKTIIINLDTFKLTEQIENEYRKISENYLVKFYLASEFYATKLKRNSYELIGKIPLIPLFTYPLDNSWHRMTKRLFDILFSLFVLIFVMSWLYVIIAIIIKWQSPGPILYIHERIGINNKPFKCLKFRTMNVRSKDEPFQQTVKGDKRIFSFGQFLRKTNLDEFPQFVNSLRGEISIVGPRPMMLGHMLEFDQEIEEMYSRHLVKPGITGLAQVTGFRGEIDGVNKMRGRIRMDRYYLQNWSFIFDIKIIWWTVKNSILGDKDAI